MVLSGRVALVVTLLGSADTVGRINLIRLHPTISNQLDNNKSTYDLVIRDVLGSERDNGGSRRGLSVD